MALIERNQQLQILGDIWRAVKAGAGHVVLVSGEAGIGKTSLVHQFVAEQARSSPVFWGACDALFSPQPLGPFIEIALQIQSDATRKTQSENHQLTFSTELLTYLQQSPTPIIVVVEDLHWADEATLDMVKFLGRRLQHTHALLCLTYRDDEISRQHPLWHLLGDFPAHITNRIVLPPLSPAAVDRLAQQANCPFEDLYQITGGNPFFVTEVIGSNSKGVPPSLRDAVLTRVAKLSPEATKVVEATSLMPRGAEMRLLDEILDPKSTAIDECVEHGILHAQGNRLAFRHELARRAVEDSLPLGRLTELHKLILAVLSSRQDDPNILSQLVHHAALAGDEIATIRFAPLAGKQASELGAHREAASLYRTILSYKFHLSPETHTEMLENLSIESYLLGNVEEAIQARLEALRLWQQLQRRDRIGDCKRWLSRLSWALGRGKEARLYADEAVEALTSLANSPELAMAISNKAQLHMVAEEEAPALEWGQRAIHMAQELRHTEIYVHALINIGSMEFQFGGEARSQTLVLALKVARDNELHDHASRCFANLADNYIDYRQYAKAQEWISEGLAYTSARDLDFYTSYLLGALARVDFEMGQWADAEKHALESTRLSHGRSVLSFPALTVLGHLKIRQGDPTGKDILEQTKALAYSCDEIQRIGPLTAARVEAAWWEGDSSTMMKDTIDAYEMAIRLNSCWTAAPLAYWLWRAGTRDIFIDQLPKPYRLMIQDDWQPAAQEWERLGCPFEHALALAAGDNMARMKALDIFEQLGARPAAEVMRKDLRKSGVRDSDLSTRLASSKTNVDLTPRQVEVLQLVAEGLSNPAIAQQLIISIGTVKAHTASIYQKLGVKNRVQAISRARELQLL